MPVIHKVVAVSSNRFSLSFDKSFLGLAFLVLVSQPALVAGEEGGVREDLFRENGPADICVKVFLSVVLPILILVFCGRSQGRAGSEPVGSRGRRVRSQREAEAKRVRKLNLEREERDARLQNKLAAQTSEEQILEEREVRLCEERQRDFCERTHYLMKWGGDRAFVLGEIEQFIRVCEARVNLINDDSYLISRKPYLRTSMEKLGGVIEELKKARDELKYLDFKAQCPKLEKESVVWVNCLEGKILSGNFSSTRTSLSEFLKTVERFKSNLKYLQARGNFPVDTQVLFEKFQLLSSVLEDIETKGPVYLRYYREFQVQCIPEDVRDQSYVRAFVAQCQRSFDVLDNHYQHRYYTGPAAIDAFNEACRTFNSHLIKYREFWETMERSITRCWESVGSLSQFKTTRLSGRIQELRNFHNRQKSVIANSDPTGIEQRCRQAIYKFDTNKAYSRMREEQRVQEKKDELKEVIKSRIRQGFRKEVPWLTDKYDLCEYRIREIHEQARKEVRQEREEARRQEELERERRRVQYAQRPSAAATSVSQTYATNDDSDGITWMSDQDFQAIEREERRREREEAQRQREKRRQEEDREQQEREFRERAEIQRQEEAAEQRRRDEEYRRWQDEIRQREEEALERSREEARQISERENHGVY